MRSDVEIEVRTADRARLEAIVAAPSSPQKHVWRARIILLSAAGVGTMAIAREAGVAKPTVWRWRQRFLTEGVAGLLREKSRPPGIAPLSPEVVRGVVALTSEPPPGEATHWTVRTMAKAVGISHASAPVSSGLPPDEERRLIHAQLDTHYRQQLDEPVPSRSAISARARPPKRPRGARKSRHGSRSSKTMARDRAPATR